MSRLYIVTALYCHGSVLSRLYIVTVLYYHSSISKTFSVLTNRLTGQRVSEITYLYRVGYKTLIQEINYWQNTHRCPVVKNKLHVGVAKHSATTNVINPGLDGPCIQLIVRLISMPMKLSSVYLSTIHSCTSSKSSNTPLSMTVLHTSGIIHTRSNNQDVYRQAALTAAVISHSYCVTTPSLIRRGLRGVNEWVPTRVSTTAEINDGVSEWVSVLVQTDRVWWVRGATCWRRVTVQLATPAARPTSGSAYIPGTTCICCVLDSRFLYTHRPQQQTANHCSQWRFY